LHISPNGTASENIKAIFDGKCRGLNKTLHKQRNEERIKSQQSKSKTVLKIDIKKFAGHKMVKRAIKTMAPSVNDDIAGNLQKFLIARLILNSGACTGVLRGISLKDVQDA
jgi:hypothetical protein